MRPNISAQLGKQRFALMVLLKAACVSFLSGVVWAQELLPCHPETQRWTVANANDTATLARMLQCSNGSFIVHWVGHVSVTHVMYITQGTSLNISGASSGATADGNHLTQLFAADDVSSLHLTDMILTNGDAEFGGAVLALDQASISFGGNMTFSSNTALHGGAIFAGQSTTMFWDTEETVLNDNNASNEDAIMTHGSSDISWDGTTTFFNNSAKYAGGAVYIADISSISWRGRTTFLENSAVFGGGIYAASSTVIWADDETTFINNKARYDGGALLAVDDSSVYWYGETEFSSNSAGDRGGAIFAYESLIMVWSSYTVFTENTAFYGGAICANSSRVVLSSEVAAFPKHYASIIGGAPTTQSTTSNRKGGGTVFMNNKALDSGGAVLLANHSMGSWNGSTKFVDNSAVQGGAVIVTLMSTSSWEGDTVFMNNTAEKWGGGVLIGSHSTCDWTGNTTFQTNRAHTGGAVSVKENSTCFWDGTATFTSNTVISIGGALAVFYQCYVAWTDETTFTSNVADKGGAIYVHESTLSWMGCTAFDNNVANEDGGAVYVGSNSRIYCGGTTNFSKNTAATGNGGALGIYEYSSADGQNVHISSDTTFSNNSAFANGGAIYAATNPEGKYYEGVVFRSNSARTGGAVAMFGTGNLDEAKGFTTFVRCQFVHNTAVETGGAVETAFGRDAFVDTQFDRNTAGVGGAICLRGEATIHNCSFTSNMASNRGLAVSTVGLVTVNVSSFDGNGIVCGEGEIMQEVLKESSRTAHYDSVCNGCPPWNQCLNCTVSDGDFVPACSVAPEHTTAAPGSTVETLVVDKGFWRATKDTSTILACYNAGSCIGGQTGSDSFCDDGYMGPYCSVCQSGYSSSLSKTCTRCSASRRRGFVAMAVITGIVAVFAMAAFSRYLVSTNFEEPERSSVFYRVIRKAPLQALKSVIVVWQILTQFASVANVTYPGVYQTFLSSVDIINLDVGFVLSAGCLWLGIDFHDRLIADTIVPLMILGVIGMTYAIALRTNHGSHDRVREKIRNKHLSAVLWLLFLVYSSVSSTVFRMFACDPLDDGEEYLRADYRILCTGAKHRALQVYAAVMIAVYPIGIPLLFGVLLYRRRGVLSQSRGDKAVALSIVGLWAPYRPSHFYYEIVECARRIMLTGVVVFIYPNDTAQIAITILISFSFFLVSEILSPYKSVSDTWLSRCGHVIIVFSIFDVLLLKVDASDESSESQQILAGVFVAVHIVMVVAVVAEFVGLSMLCIKTGGRWQRRQRQVYP